MKIIICYQGRSVLLILFKVSTTCGIAHEIVRYSYKGHLISTFYRTVFVLLPLQDGFCPTSLARRFLSYFSNKTVSVLLYLRHSLIFYSHLLPYRIFHLYILRLTCHFYLGVIEQQHKSQNFINIARVFYNIPYLCVFFRDFLEKVSSI